MKFPISIIIILFNCFFCSSIKATKWTKVTTGQNGHSFFIDMNKLNENKGYVFFWQLINYYKKDEYGDLSAKIYVQGDCKIFKFKWLKVAYHKMLMGQDQVKPDKPSKLISAWQFPKLGSTSYAVLEHVCTNKGLLL